MRVRLTAAQRQLAVERERRLDGTQFDHARHGIPLLGAHHGRRLDRVAARGDRRVREDPIYPRAHVRCPRAVCLNDDVGGDERARFMRQAVAKALDDRAQHDNGAHADRDAHEEEQQASPRGAQLTERHVEDEGHGRSRQSESSVRVVRESVISRDRRLRRPAQTVG